VELDIDQITAYPTLIAEHVKPRAKNIEQKVNLFDEYVLFTDEFLREHGYKRVRIESWSKKGNYATVNLEMEGPLIAFGSGAIGFTGGYEYVNIMNVHKYIRKVKESGFGASHGKIVSEEERLIRIAMDKLYFGRLDEEHIKQKLGKSFKDFPMWLKMMLLFLRARGYIKKENNAYIVLDKALPLMHKMIWTFVLKIPCRIVMKGILYQNKDFMIP